MKTFGGQAFVFELEVCTFKEKHGFPFFRKY
jgi:hypothetical protein